ncbi:G protein [Maize yellow striate virus]|uniref:G protein n=1 Tax=Maize yellow striate virus TaxID=1168550 RepID=A0A2D1GTP0_9RHAB|nr:G protein [Maize yellow striate virus]ATN96441.1 G protein [Maize yellow striate virus]
MSLLLLFAVALQGIRLTGAFSALSCNQTAEYPSTFQCLQSCEGIKTGEHIGLDILQQNVESIIPVGKCTWVTEERAFTETWTFSRFASETTKSFSPASVHECRGMFNNNCKNRPGCVSGEVPITPLYSWARTEIRRSKYLHIETMNVTTYPYEGKGKILLENKPREVEDLSFSSGDYIYVWDKIDKKAECPWTNNTKTMSCHYQGDKKQHIICPGAGLVFWNITEIKTACKWTIMQDSSGVIFRVVNNASAEWYPAQIESGNEALKTLIEGVRYSLRLRDSVSCYQQCGQLGQGIVFFDGYYYTPNQHKCNVISGCSINRYTYSCNDDKYIWTRCHSKSVWINMETAEIIGNPTCDHDKRKRLSKEDALKMIDRYHNTTKLFSVMNVNIIKDVELKDEEFTEIARVLRTNASVTGFYREDSWIGSMNPMSAIRSFLGVINHEIKVAVFTLIGIYGGWKLYQHFPVRKHKGSLISVI